MIAIHDRLTEMIETAGMAHNSLEDAVQFIVRHYCQIADDDWTLFKYHILHMHHFPRISTSAESSPIGAAAELLSREMERGTIRHGDPYILAAMALGVVLQTAQAKVFGYIDGPLGARTDLFARKVLAVLDIETED